MIKIPQPEWMKDLNGNLFVTELEVKQAFGVHSKSEVNRLILQGVIPEPAQRKARNKERPERLLWKVSDLRKVFKKD